MKKQYDHSYSDQQKIVQISKYQETLQVHKMYLDNDSTSVNADPL